ncbi:MAG: (Fe-S)-binding protein [Microscillaceae bacterium]|nr:(Fe-S)-binding protein [Microscillaceae bacterium]MDW8460938.1 (Fe-S)-binding protein [Cytophagales bacterium]
MKIFSQIIFILLLVGEGYLISRRVRRLAGNIQLGRSINLNNNPSARWKAMLLVAFGQKKMFSNPLVGIMHFIIYAGFILINIEVLEILLDGITGSHRLFAPFLGSFYTFLIGFFELLAVGVIIACIIFLMRRNVLKIERFQKPELKGFPMLDANIILFTEIALMVAILCMNAADGVLQLRGNEHYVKAGTFFFSRNLIPLFESLPNGVLVFIERFCWWFHIVGIMGFALYVTYSKHLHIFMAFPNTYFSNLNPKGKFENMEVITKEVKLAMGLIQDDGQPAEITRFGAKDVNDLTWKNLMDAYSCTECGRCTASCPANITGKKLSPRKIMMDTRDRADEVGRYIEQGKTKEEALAMGNSLYSERYISKEEVLACTTCNACVEACPVNINPLDIIMQIRNYIAMEEAATPAQWNVMFQNIENNASPWKFSTADRANWLQEV